MDSLYLVGVAVLAVIAFVFCIILFNFFGIWLRARIANAPVEWENDRMRLRRPCRTDCRQPNHGRKEAGIEI